MEGLEILKIAERAYSFPKSRLAWNTKFPSEIHMISMKSN